MNPFRFAWNSLTSIFHNRDWNAPGETHGLKVGYGPTKAGPPVNQDTAMSVSAFFAGIRILTETPASLPLNVHRRISAKEQEIAYTHPVQSVIHDTPNEELTAKLFWQMFDSYKYLWGNGLAEIEWDMGGNCRGLHLLEPWRVKRKREDNGRGRSYYEVSEKNREPRKIFPPDILHIPFRDGYWGVSVLEYARESLSGAMAARDYGNSYFGHGGVPSGVLEHPGKLTDAARKNVRGEWLGIHSPAHGGTAATVAVLQEGMKYNKISLPPKDSQFLENRAFDISEMSRWLGVPPHFLGDLSQAKYANIEEQGRDLVMYTLLPLLVEREQEINRKLLKRSQHYAKHNVAALLRGNMLAQSQFFREMFNIGVYSDNDIRELLEMNPVPGGDQHFVQLQMTTLDRVQDEIDARITQAEEPPAPAAEPSSGDDLAAARLAAHRLAISAAAKWPIHKEASKAVQAAATPKTFQSWLDNFYPHHEEQLALAIQPAVAAALVGTGLVAAEVAGELAANHCRQSRELLLKASEVTADQFAQSVAACVMGWDEKRAADMAAGVPLSQSHVTPKHTEASEVPRCLPA